MPGRLARLGFRARLVGSATATGPQTLDFSGARIDPGQIKAAGLIGVCRYQWIVEGTRPQFNRDKAISKAEYDSYRNAGLAVALICQVDKVDYQGGYARGFDYGRRSLQHSRAMGHPDAAPILLAVQDATIPASDYPMAVEYCRGFKDGRAFTPPIVYGGTNIINRCVNASVAIGGWRAAALSWSTEACPSLVLIQKTSKSYPQWSPLAYDENDIVGKDWGQNPRPGVDPASLCIFGYPCPWHH